ncbi:hypothetical protein [Plantactinospora sp. CA-290183]|uniref:hypothetical protein n=1 Tax=Plantactinospora sp. CA-290183 TaxID=3240006 RepID=UPI003D8CE864
MRRKRAVTLPAPAPVAGVGRPVPAAHGRTDRFTYQLVEEGSRGSATATIRFPA